MKPVFAARASDAFWSLMHDFAESLVNTFPDCPESKDWKLWMHNVIGDDPVQRAEGLQTWHTQMDAPLRKGAAKYAKAVASLTGQPATTYHAVRYRDADALHASATDQLRALDFPHKLETLSVEDRSVFWQYIEELARLSYEAHKATPPAVPTSDEIAQDIQRRKGGGAATGAGAFQGKGVVGLQQGLHDVWVELCKARDVAVVDDTSSLATRLQALQVGTRDASAVVAACPEVGDGPWTDPQWALLDKALSLAAMDGAIPAPMMRGIENVAHGLARDLAEGRADLSSLDIESIGQKVLAGVSNEDVSSFASNLDKILPALDKVQPKAP